MSATVPKSLPGCTRGAVAVACGVARERLRATPAQPQRAANDGRQACGPPRKPCQQNCSPPSCQDFFQPRLGGGSTLFVKGFAVSPLVRLSLSLMALGITCWVGGVYWPSRLGLVFTLVALLLLLPLAFVAALDAIRYLNSRAATPGSNAVRVALSIPLGLLAFLALGIGIAFAVFVGIQWSVESPRLLIGGAIAGAMFFGFGMKLLQVLWPRKHD